ncbi:MULTISPECIES: IclR family transcriptional regulator [unclassified Microbacterium]|uniref:IclR family transcriptional regulator n=1 Tax=unclassified Microbacterium TaxID=2609290 RepID=UPI003139FA33
MANSSTGDSVVARVLRVLDTFTPTRTVQTRSEIGRRAGLPSSTAHRIVNDLVESGVLERDEHNGMRVGVRLWELATRSSDALRLRQAALPSMERVQARIGEHTQLAVREADEALFLERLSSPESGANITKIAGRLPLHASSSGLVLLAFADRATRERVLSLPMKRLTKSTITESSDLRRKLNEVRSVGFSIAPGYVEEVSTGVAVPIRGERGVIAALSVVLPRDSPTEGPLVAIIQAARDIERALGAHRQRSIGSPLNGNLGGVAPR